MVNIIKPNFPEWAPKQVISEWKEKVEEIEYWFKKFPTVEPETEEADLLVRLLTYEDMKGVWKKLAKYKIKPTLFSSMIQLSNSYIDAKPHNLTPKEYTDWLNDVKATALKLRNLVQHSDYDRIFQEAYLQKRQKLVLASIVEHSIQVIRPDVDIEEHKKTKPSYESWPDLAPGYLSEALNKIVTLDSDKDIGFVGSNSREPVKLDKPNHPNAKRSYFIKKLTQLLRDKTGQPLREVVTITAATVFDNPSLTERQIIRIAPWHYI
jgi:hypothetical protein